MNVLFVYSGNHESNFNLVENQGKTLENSGLHVEYYPVIGKGFWGYWKQIIPLRRRIKTGNFDIVHAHYSFSGIISVLAGANPIVVSLLGSDVFKTFFWRYLVKIVNYYFWDVCIVKSQLMKECIKITKAKVIPNGVNIDFFKPLNKKAAIDKLNWNINEINILFAANPDRPEKNFKLAHLSTKNLQRSDVKLHFLEDVKYEYMPCYINAADILLLTSFWEGSPNVIKEAMACNCPIVSTDIGDVKEVIGNTEGCYIASFDPDDVVEKIKQALEFSSFKGLTNGRERIFELGLDSEAIAKRLIEVYNDVLND